MITGEAVVVLLGFNYDNHDDNDTDDRDFDHDLQDLGHGLSDDNDYEEVSGICTNRAKLCSLLARWLFGNRQALICRSNFCDNHQRATSREKRHN